MARGIGRLVLPRILVACFVVAFVALPLRTRSRRMPALVWVVGLYFLASVALAVPSL
jgi:hypothetical protein